MKARAKQTLVETNAGRVLVVDDHAQARESMIFILRQAGHQVEGVSSAVEALKRLDAEAFDVIVTDLQMPGMTGLEFIRELDRRKDGAQVVMVTAFATVQSAVEAMRHGALDYIEKPFAAQRLEELVLRALGRGRLLDEQPKLATTAAGETPSVLVGSSRAMQELRTKIRQIAPTLETVLITGESGTGKELVARAIHAASERAGAPLVSLNCPVLSAHLTESELFGHERGAFTGAEAARAGRFELAHGGTLLLDEVTEIDLTVQAKLLRVLQERTFERVGSSRTIEVDVRVLATSNRDLKAEVAGGSFREDLYYRLAVLPVNVPALRSRREDVPELIEHFLAASATRLRRDACELETSAVDLLVNYHWPGNVRELENLMTRASVLSTGSAVTADELRPWLLDGDQGAQGHDELVPVGLSLEKMERRLIEATLEHMGGHRAKTAKALGIGIRTLAGKLKDYGYAPRAKVGAQAA
jgi:DNA-binding NtrC family response regulator